MTERSEKEPVKEGSAKILSARETMLDPKAAPGPHQSLRERETFLNWAGLVTKQAGKQRQALKGRGRISATVFSCNVYFLTKTKEHTITNQPTKKTPPHKV